MRPGLFLVVMALAGVWQLSPAAAQPRRAPGVQPLDKILPDVRRTHPGQFFDADGPHREPDGSEHYHLKWMTPDGRMEWLDTDARTGRVLGSSPGRDSFDRHTDAPYAGRGPYAGQGYRRMPSRPEDQDGFRAPSRHDGGGRDGYAGRHSGQGEFGGGQRRHRGRH